MFRESQGINSDEIREGIIMEVSCKKTFTLTDIGADELAAIYHSLESALDNEIFGTPEERDTAFDVKWDIEQVLDKALEDD